MLKKLNNVRKETINLYGEAYEEEAVKDGFFCGGNGNCGCGL